MSMLGSHKNFTFTLPESGRGTSDTLFRFILLIVEATPGIICKSDYRSSLRQLL